MLLDNTEDFKSRFLDWQNNIQEDDSKLEVCNVTIIGHVDHGKTTTSAAITVCLSKLVEGLNKKSHDILARRNKPLGFKNLDKNKEEQARQITIQAAHIPYSTLTRKYSHADCPGHSDFVKNIIANSNNIDCGILLVSVTDGIIPQSREHLILAKQIGITKLVFLLNKVDQISEEELEITCELTVAEIKDNLKANGFSDKEIEACEFIKISAVQAIEGQDTEYGTQAIYKLLIALDRIPVKPRDLDKEFVVPISENLGKSGRGSVATGLIISGRTYPNHEVILVGYGKEIPVCIKDIEVYNKRIAEGLTGQNAGILVKGIEGNTISKEDLSRGKLLADKNAYRLVTKLVIKARVLTKAEGGREKSFAKNFQPQFFILTANITGVVEKITTTVVDDTKITEVEQPLARTGQVYDFTIKLIKSIAIPVYSGVPIPLRVTIRSDNKTIAVGIVREYLD